MTGYERTARELEPTIRPALLRKYGQTRQYLYLLGKFYTQWYDARTWEQRVQLCVSWLKVTK